MTKRREWINGTDWDFISDKDDILLEELTVPGSDVTCVRARMVLKNVNYDKLLQELYNPTYEQRVQVYDELLAHNVTNEIDRKIVVAHSHYKAPFPVTNRDFLALRTYQEKEEGTHLIAVQSINDKEIPHESGSVRGTSNCGVLLVPNYAGVKGDVLCVTVDHIDPKGSVPNFVIRMYKQKASDRLVRMQTVYGL